MNTLVNEGNRIRWKRVGRPTTNYARQAYIQKSGFAQVVRPDIYMVKASLNKAHLQVDKEVQASDISYRLLAFVKAYPQYGPFQTFLFVNDYGSLLSYSSIHYSKASCPYSILSLT